ncbi:MAG: universal stress protein [Myxococcota bacterium]
MKLTRILVGIDASPASTRAFEAALAVASRTRARLTIAHLMPSVVPIYAALPLDLSSELKVREERAKKNVRRRLGTLVARAEKAGITAEAVLREADPAAGLLAIAKKTRSSLVVIGSHGRGGAAHLLLGSVSEKVLRESRCPVLVIKRSKWRRKGRVLIALDGSPMAVRVARGGAAIAAQLGARVSVLHVLEDTRWVAEAAASAQPAAILRAITKLGIDRARKDVAATLRKAGVKVRRADVLIREGRPQDVIARTAARGAITCIIVGTHARAGATRLLLGSVAESVARRAPAPVLVLKFPR